MGVYDGTCQITGGPGVRDEEAGCVCFCLSPLVGINCDGSPKTPPPPPGKTPPPPPGKDDR